MQFLSVFILNLASLALAAPVPRSSALVARDTGLVNIHNNCNFPVQVDTALPGADNGTEPIPANTTWTHEQANYGGAGQGVSLKISPANAASHGVAQLEYTISDDMNLLFYDLSLIDGNPFSEYTQNLTANGHGSDVFCDRGVLECHEAYMSPYQALTKAARSGTNLDFYICG